MSKLTTALIFLVTVAVLYFGREVFIPLVLSFLLAMLLAGPVRQLERWRFPRVLAATVVVVLAFGVIVFIGWLVGNQIYTLASNIEAYQAEIIQKVGRLRGTEPGVVEKLGELGEKLEEAAERPTSTAPTSAPATQPDTQPIDNIPVIGPIATDAMKTAGVNAPVASATRPSVDNDDARGSRDNPLYAFVMPMPLSPLRTLSGYVGIVLTPMATAGLVLVFVFFILLEREDLRDRMIRLVSQGQYTLTTTAVDDGVDRIVRYIRAQAIVNGTYGIAVAIGLWAIGMIFTGEAFPSFALWGLLAAVLRFVPYIGPWVAAAFPLTLSIAAYHGFGVFAAVITMFIIIELASNNIMEPILYGSTTGLSVMAILVAAIFWTWLWGPIGLLLATPLTVILMVIGRYVPGLHFLEVLLGDRPAMSHFERVYQRLLAGDDEEAMQVAEEHAEEHGVPATFDEVLLPALALSERDAAQGLLQDERQDAVSNGIRAIIAALGKQAEAGDAADDPNQHAEPTPDDKCIRVAVLPAHDEADELAGLMLCRLLEDADIRTLHFSHHALAGEMVDQVAQFSPHVVFVSSTPPSSVGHIRYLLRRVRGGLSGKKLAIGIWSARSTIETLKERLKLDDAPVATSLAKAVEQLKQITEADRFAMLNKNSEEGARQVSSTQ